MLKILEEEKFSGFGFGVCRTVLALNLEVLPAKREGGRGRGGREAVFRPAWEWKERRREMEFETPCLNDTSETLAVKQNPHRCSCFHFCCLSRSVIFLLPSRYHYSQENRGQKAAGWELWKVPCFGKSSLDTLVSVLPSVPQERWCLLQVAGTEGPGRQGLRLSQEC